MKPQVRRIVTPAAIRQMAELNPPITTESSSSDDSSCSESSSASESESAADEGEWSDSDSSTASSCSSSESSESESEEDQESEEEEEEEASASETESTSSSEESVDEEEFPDDGEEDEGGGMLLAMEDDDEGDASDSSDRPRAKRRRKMRKGAEIRRRRRATAKLDEQWRQQLEKMYQSDLIEYVREHVRREELTLEDTQQLAYVCEPDTQGMPHDPFHRTMPVLTKFEIAAILKWRVAQLQYDPMTYLRGPDGEYMMLPHISPYLIAQEELRRKVLPLLIKRPFHHGHSHEVWRLQDLLLLQPLEIDTKQLSFEPKENMTMAERLQSLVV